jgi:hypothetical protein
VSDPILDAIERRLAALRTPSFDVSDEHCERTLMVIIAGARIGNPDCITKVARMREGCPSQIDALVAAEAAQAAAPKLGGVSVPLGNRFSVGQPDGDGVSETPPTPVDDASGMHRVFEKPEAPATLSTGNRFPVEAPRADRQPAPSEWDTQFYGPDLAHERMRGARHPEESDADFEQRVREGRRNAAAARRFADRARVINPDDLPKTGFNL